jgi:hypothetical protein
MQGKQLQNQKIEKLQAEVNGLQKGMYILYVTVNQRPHFYKVSV